ncbi:MAG: metal ABC transporter permease [Gluconacetobacter diazotrophicus]|nr:metal ABC transporter permease [Gluconacetobacter diazotrophicus]
MLSFDFMRHAFAAGAVVAVVSGLVGFFLVLRGQSFAGHALSHVGFTGATGAVLLGAPPLWGLIAATLLSGIGMGALGDRIAGRDVAIGLVLAGALALGLLFLHFFTAYASQATALLFGNVFGVDRATVRTLALVGLVSLLGLALVARPLLFATLQPELAEARGVPLRLLSILFLSVVALATAGCAQIVGVLLVFTLMVGPAAAAQRVASTLGVGLALSAVLALIECWGGIALAWFTDWPASFWITALSGLAFVACAVVSRTARGDARRAPKRIDPVGGLQAPGPPVG